MHMRLLHVCMISFYSRKMKTRDVDERQSIVLHKYGLANTPYRIYAVFTVSSLLNINIRDTESSLYDFQLALTSMLKTRTINRIPLTVKLQNNAYIIQYLVLSTKH